MDNQGEQRQESNREKALNAYNKYAQARALASLAKTGGRLLAKGAARGAVLALGATAEVWVPIVATIAVVALFTFLIVQFGNAPQTNGQEETSAQTSTETLSPTTPIPPQH